MSITLYNDKYYADEPFLIRRTKSSGYNVEPAHTHDFIELIYTYKGRVEHVIDDEKHETNRGDLLFVNYGSSHGFETDNSLEYVNIIIKPDYVSQSLKGVQNAFALLTLSDFKEFSDKINKANCHIHFSGDERTRVELLIDLMEKEFENKNAGGEVVLRSALDIFLTLVFRKMSLRLSDRMSLDGELLDYIKTNCGQPLTLKSVAAMCFYNPSYFSRAFKNYAGITFVEYLTKCRMDMACKMLESTDMKTDDVMTHCGFSDRTAFFNKFFKYTGQTPQKYRKSKK